MLQTLIMLLAPAEMLLVNLFVIDRCSQRRYGRVVTFIVMALFAVPLLAGTFAVMSKLPHFGQGDGLFIFFGFLFIVPLKLLYRVPAVTIISVACTSWVYTFLLFALSVRISYALGTGNLALATLLAQTVLYILTLWPFYKALKDKLLYVLRHISRSQAMALMWMSMMWFWTVFIFNLSFAYPKVQMFQILSLLTLAVCAIASYRYIYLQTHSEQAIQNLEKIAYQDNLTQLRSRVVLESDVNDLIRRNIPFSLVFMDLNDFKSINDQYGHLAGDEYLAFFAREMKLRIAEGGGFYRIAGDEFVCVYTGTDIAGFLRKIGTLPAVLPDSGIVFLGVSYGVALFPADGATLDGLLQAADEKMYRMKRAEHRRRRA